MNVHALHAVVKKQDRELTIAKSNLLDLLKLAWELNNGSLSEEEFENLQEIKDAREQLTRLGN